MSMQESFVGGMHAVKALLRSTVSGVAVLYVQDGRQDARMQSVVDLAKRCNVAIETRSKRELDELCGNLEHQGVVAKHVGKAPGGEQDLFSLISALNTPAIILVLDGIQDPHNLGACLRSADAAGVHAVVAPSDNSVGMTPTVRKVASGAAESVAFFQVTNLKRTLKKMQDLGVWIHGAAGEADTELFDVDLTGPVAIVMGSEGSGLRRLTRESCDVLFKIPMLGEVSSLNVSVATGITLFEMVRQRRAASI